METEKLNNNKEDTENDEILRIPYFSKSRTKVIKQTVKVKKTIQEEDELDENKTEKEIEEEENIVSQSHKTRVKLNLHELRNQPAKNNLFKNKGTEVNKSIKFSFLYIKDNNNNSQILTFLILIKYLPWR